MKMTENSILEFVGTCSDREISRIAELPGKLCSYKLLVRLIKQQHEDIYNDLSLNFYNPYCNQATIIKHESNTYVNLVWSAIDYLFILS